MRPVRGEERRLHRGTVAEDAARSKILVRRSNLHFEANMAAQREVV
jgi:hypothetical protein